MDVEAIIYALVLGVVQGITEFLPISSSAHLIIVSWMAKGQSLSLALNVALHLGTLSAVLLYFHRDWRRLSVAGLDLLLAPKKVTSDRWLLLSLILGSVPAGLVGLIWKDDIERVLHHPVYTIAPLILVGIGMWWGDRIAPVRKDLKQMSLRDGFLVGICQAMALLPGTSRSGVTILGGRLLGYDRQSAARYSFLLGTPAMLGAALLSMGDLANSWQQPEFYLGFLSSLLVGLVSIKLLLTILRRYGFFHFMVYRIILAVILTITII